jgi:hypothetical protein
MPILLAPYSHIDVHSEPWGWRVSMLRLIPGLTILSSNSHALQNVTDLSYVWLQDYHSDTLVAFVLSTLLV